MRENTKWIMLLTALAFVGLMVFEWGMDMTGRTSLTAGGPVGRVNGEEVSYEEWLAVYNNALQQQQAAAGGQMTPAMRRQVEDAAWDQIVNQRLLQQELERRGIRVSDDEIREAAQVAPPPELQSAPVFQTDGQFDPVKYQQFLASSRDPAFLLQLEAYYRDVIPRSKLYFQTAAGVHATDGQLWRMYRDANETVTVQYVAFDPYAMVPAAEITVSDAAVRSYYNENRDHFLRPAQVDVRYVIMNAEPPASDSVAAWTRANELRAEAVAGQPFEEVAQQAADDAGRVTGYGQPFSTVRGQSVPVIDQAVFSTAAGSITQPVLTPAGYHVIRVDSRTGDTAQVRQFVVPIQLSRVAEDSILDRADQLEDLAQTDGLARAADRMGLTVHPAQLTPALPMLAGAGAIQEGLDWAMVADPGQISDVMEGDQFFYVLELVSRREEGPLRLEEAAPTIRTTLTRMGQVERARTRLEPAAQRAAAGESLEAIASELNGSLGYAGPFTRGDAASGLGQLTPAVGAAFALAPGQNSPVIESDGQLFVIRGLARTEASRTAWQEQVNDQRAMVLNALTESRWNQFMAALREDAKIVDNRNRVLRATPVETARF